MNDKQQPVPADHEPLAKASDGPFFCVHCKYFDPGSAGCGERHILAKYGERKQRDGKVTVHPFQCSDYYESNGERITLPVIVAWLKLYAKHVVLNQGDKRGYPPGHQANS